MSAAYFEDDLVTLYLGDALTKLQWIEADALVTDPPYGIAYRSGSRRADTTPREIAGDIDTTVRDRALAMWGPQKPALVFGSWRQPRPSATKTLLVWDTKGALGMGDLSIPWKPSHQEIYVLGGPFTGPRTSDVLVCPPVQSSAANGRLHINQKPVALLHELIAKTTGVIADPFAGSGSTLVAARQMGRRAIGVEIDEQHAETIAKRFARETGSHLDWDGAA